MITGSTDIGGGSLFIKINHDPTAESTDCPKGSFIQDSNELLFYKLDDGDTTNVEQMMVLNSYNKTTDPGTGDDNTKGYKIGSIWINTAAVTDTNRMWRCLDTTTDAAVWKKSAYQ